jgi:hypothetical protein
MSSIKLDEPLLAEFGMWMQAGITLHNGAVRLLSAHKSLLQLLAVCSSGIIKTLITEI